MGRFPTREATVAALSRHRAALLEHFRIPTPEWEVTKWAWDKRKTYERADELGIPVPRAWRASSEEPLRGIDGEPPYVIKPAIKEHFFYATKAKAWRADSREELVLRFRQAAGLVGPGEVVVQELIPGNGHTQLEYCAFFKDDIAPPSMVVRRLRQHLVEFGRASTFVRTVRSGSVRRGVGVQPRRSPVPAWPRSHSAISGSEASALTWPSVSSLRTHVWKESGVSVSHDLEACRIGIDKMLSMWQPC